MYGADGQVSAGPFLYLNTLGQVKVKHPFVYQSPQDGKLLARERHLEPASRAAGDAIPEAPRGYLQNYSQGLVILNPVAPDPDTSTGAYLLSGVGSPAIANSRSPRACGSRARGASCSFLMSTAAPAAI